MNSKCPLWWWLVLLPVLSMRAQDVTLKLGSAEARFGSEVEIPLLVESDAPVAGLTVACGWDGSVGTGVELRDLAVDAADPRVLVHVAEVRSDHMILAIGLNPSPTSSLLGPGEIHLATLVIRCRPGPATPASAIAFRDGIYDTAPPGPFPLSNAVTVFAGAGFPQIDVDRGLTLADGAFRCVPGSDFSLRLEDAAGDVDAPVAVVLRLTADLPVSGVAAVFDWDAAAGTGMALDVDPAIAASANFVGAHVANDWMSLGVVTVESPLTGNDIPLATATIRCRPGTDGAATPIVFRDGVHRVPLSPIPRSNLLTVGSASVGRANGLELLDGSFRCLAGACAVEDVACARARDGIRLSWALPVDPDCGSRAIEVRDAATGAALSALAPDATGLEIPCRDLGERGALCVVSIGPDGSEEESCCDYVCPAFRRGDGNDDGTLDASDGVAVLGCLFRLLECPGCLDAGDCNDDGALDVSDAICIFGCVFGAGSCRDPDLLDCAVDGTTDVLECSRYASCP